MGPQNQKEKSQPEMGGFAFAKKIKFIEFLTLLKEGNEYASDLTTSPWDFAMSLNEALALKVNSNDLRWMMLRDWISCSTMSPLRPIQKPASTETLRGPIPLNEQSRFVLSRTGMQVLASEIGGDPSPYMGVLRV